MKYNQITSTRTKSLSKTLVKFVMSFTTKMMSEALMIFGEKTVKIEKLRILRKYKHLQQQTRITILKMTQKRQK